MGAQDIGPVGKRFGKMAQRPHGPVDTSGCVLSSRLADRGLGTLAPVGERHTFK